ncbi:MAG: hypothetical protein HPY44_10220 [Armatimonadetes bacterium]|nr:hypothetical protein [Armatimonadota bacterium]
MKNKIRIGWAQRDITPQGPVSLHGQFNLRIATRVQDPLTLTALVLQRDDDHAAIVSVDACSVAGEVLREVRAALAERVPELDPHKIIIGATHTHTGPFNGTGGWQQDAEYLDAIRARYPDYVTVAEYTEMLIEALVDAVCEAWKRRSEGHIGWGYSHAVVGENRRVRYFDGSAKMYGSTSVPEFSHIEGHVDHGVNLLFTYDSARNLTGVLINLACPSQASESGQDFVSADYWHDVREELRRRLGAGLFVLPQCSAAGDQSPHRLIAKKAEDRMLQLKYGGGVGRPLNAALRTEIACRIADATVGAETVIRGDLRDRAVLKHENRTLQLEHWRVTAAEHADLMQDIAEAERQLAELGDADRLGSQYTSLRSRIAWCRRAVDRYENPPDSVPTEVNVLRVGDIALVTAPFEYYLDFGDRIKGRSPAVQTFVVQLVVGGPYLATERAAEGLSYGAVPASCNVSPAGGQQLVDEAVGILETMFAAD